MAVVFLFIKPNHINSFTFIKIYIILKRKCQLKMRIR